MEKLPFDGCCVRGKRRNYIYLSNIGYSQSCKTPFQHEREYIYLKDGYMFPADTKIGDEIEIPVVKIEYGEPKIKDKKC